MIFFKLFAFIFLITGFAVSATAETVRVRSGDHPGFARLVIELPEPIDWRLGRVEGGYGLDVLRPDLRFNIRDVYRLIGRDRLADIRQDAETGRLLLDLACECHAKAVDFSTSWIVIDLLDGPAPEGWAFETPLNTAAEILAPIANESGGAGGQRLARPSEENASPNAFLEDPDAMASDQAESTRTRSPIGVPAWENQWLPDLHPSGPSNDTMKAEPESSPERESIADQERQLLQEVARATAQGLLKADLPAVEKLETLPGRDPAPVVVRLPERTIQAEDHIRIEAETVVDRDSGIFRSGNDVTPQGQRCIPDEMIALETWGGSGDVLAELAERRADLVGEFDRPNASAVLNLARYYLYLGFGAEAKATIAAFGADLSEVEVVTLVANILDGEENHLPGILAGQAACGGRVALWSVLAEGGVKPNQEINKPAILAAFSALPLHLRRHVGPSLAESFLVLGDQETAVTLRNAITRAPGPHGAKLELLDARISMAEGASDAIAQLEDLVDEDPSIAAQAYADFLKIELAAGHVPEDASQTAAAFAFENAGTELGAELAELAMRAVLASGDFEAARREALRLEEGGAAFDATLWHTFADALTVGAQDSVFLRQAFAARDVLLQAQLPKSIAIGLGQRLTDLGFAEEALRYLPDDTQDEASLLARADAMISIGSPGEALDEMATLRGPTADRIRARALLAMGDARGAAQKFQAAGDRVLAEQSAWAAGAWDMLEGSDDPTIRQFAKELADVMPSEAVAQTDIIQTDLSEGDDASGRVSLAYQAAEAAKLSRERLSILLSEKASP